MILLLVGKDAQGCAPRILELPRAQSPQEREEPQEAEGKRGRNENQQNAHKDLRGFPARRSALSVTISEDDDIAIAAMSGVTKPRTARGMAQTL